VWIVAGLLLEQTMRCLLLLLLVGQVVACRHRIM
jgi:hypothetical protein